MFAAFFSRKRKEVLKGIGFIIVYLTLCALLVIAMMPYLWPSPLQHFITILNVFAHFPEDVPNLYMGQIVTATQLPWHYIPVWMIITIPPAYLFLFFVGVVSCLIQIKKGLWAFYTEQKLSILFLLWLFLPLAMVIYLHSTLYNAWRQLFFIYPALLLFVMQGVISVLFLLRRHLFLKRVFVFCLLVNFLYLASVMISYHPYENLYFNFLAGSSQHASANFDTDYWGVTYRKGLEYVLEHDKSRKIPLKTDTQAAWTASFILPESESNRLDFDTERCYIFNTGVSALKCPKTKLKYYITTYFRSRAIPPYKEIYSITIHGVKMMGVYRLY